MNLFGIFLLFVMITATATCAVPIISAIRKKNYDLVKSLIPAAAIIISLCDIPLTGLLIDTIQLENAETYITDDFTFIYETGTRYRHVKFVDNYGREQEINIDGLIFPTDKVKVCDENKLTYKILPNKKRRCEIEEVCITKDIAEAVEYQYNRTLTASTNGVENDG